MNRNFSRRRGVAIIYVTVSMTALSLFASLAADIARVGSDFLVSPPVPG